MNINDHGDAFNHWCLWWDHLNCCSRILSAKLILGDYHLVGRRVGMADHLQVYGNINNHEL